MAEGSAAPSSCMVRTISRKLSTACIPDQNQRGTYNDGYKENWVREETCDIGDSFYALIKVDGN